MGLMLLVQQNCGKEYEYTISALETGLGLDARIVCIQEPFFWEPEYFTFGIQFILAVWNG